LEQCLDQQVIEKEKHCDVFLITVTFFAVFLPNQFILQLAQVPQKLKAFLPFWDAFPAN